MKGTVVFTTLLSIATLVASLPAPRPVRRSALNPNPIRRQNIPGIGQGPAAAPDGTPILEDEVTINGLNIRFKISAPNSALVAGGANAANGAANNNAAAAAAAAGNGRNRNNRRQNALGVNVLFHGDGGQSFFDFPNAGVNNGLMGVALLSPDPQLRWGGFDQNDATGLIRPDGQAHSEAVNEFLTQTLPSLVDFDASKIFLEGISGGSLMLSGFTIPQFGASLAVPAVVLGCGGLPPQVNVAGDISNLRIHWQSSQDELAPLQTSIPQSIVAYEQLASTAGLSNAQINQLMTADNSPNGGHCEFDEQDFVSGVQLLTDNYANIVQGNAQLNGVAVTNGVVGNENLFGNANAAAGNANANGGGNNRGNAGGNNRGNNRN